MSTELEISPIFIGGTGRSGTTAVFRVLATGRRIVSAAPELRIHIDPKGALNLLDAMTENWSPYQADGALDDFVRLVRACRGRSRELVVATRALGRRVRVSPWRYAGWSLGSYFGYVTYDDKLRELLTKLTFGRSDGYWAGTRSFTFHPTIYDTRPLTRDEAGKMIGAYFNGLYEAIAGPDDRYWIESSPYSILHADRLLEIFPGAKFVHVIRHPLDALSSYLRMHWGGKDVLAVARRLLHIHERWRLVRTRIPESSYIELRIEDIADDPERSWRTVSGLLDGDVDYNFDLSSIKSDAVHRNRWRRELDPQFQRAAQEILQPVIDRYRYDSP